MSDVEFENQRIVFKEKNYKKIKCYNPGTSSPTWHVKREKDSKDFVIKIIEKESCVFHRNKEIPREFKILQDLKKFGRKDIVKAFEWSYVKGRVLILFEHIQDFKTLLMPESMIKKVFKNIATAVAFLHENKYAHGDLKLDNVIVKEDRTIVLIDFQDSCRIDEDKEVYITGRILSKEDPMIPVKEGIDRVEEDQEVSVKTDIEKLYNILVEFKWNGAKSAEFLAFSDWFKDYHKKDEVSLKDVFLQAYVYL
uniref:Protein kinase domain-containing protein n=1 Tax=Panagrolaimus davidi TaxID=227884 RepID=A0A914QSP9_9BILA